MEPTKDIPAVEADAHKGVWEIHWMKPEPMHSIEVVSPPKDEMEHASDPPELRIEIKVVNDKDRERRLHMRS